MRTAKDIIVRPISHADAARIVQAIHYSGKTVANSQLHLGIFLDGRCHGAMQFGPSMDKRNVLGLVPGTPWNGFIELNRMAFSDALPKNSESRALGYALRLIRKQYPHIQWVISYADGTQCGDGTIYRESGFLLTGITVNKTIWEFPDGERVADLAIKTGAEFQRRKFGMEIQGTAALHKAKEMGAKPVAGHMLRYIYFIDPEARERLSVPVLPFSEIEKRGAGMYKGKRISRAGSETKDTPAPHAGKDGSNPIPAHQYDAAQ